MNSDGSYFGIAKQTAKGTPNVTDGDFKYLLFKSGGMSPNNVVVPLDDEIGGGALTRDVQKMGVYSAGGLEIIPRPDTLGLFLLAALGTDTAALVNPSTTAYKHDFALGANQFAAPYFTTRMAPGNMWGEQFQDVRLNSLALSFKGADYLRAQVGFLGGLPLEVATGAWSPTIDSGPQFTSPLSTIELPTGTPVKVLAGGFSAGMVIPLDEQWVLGSYTPDDFDIVRRAFAVNFTIKVTDATLYNKMSYDPAGGNAWTAQILREADFKMEFKSPVLADTANNVDTSLVIAGNGQSQASGNANVAWSVAPIGLRSGGNVLMNMSGIFLADPRGAGNEPITVSLTNTVASY